MDQVFIADLERGLAPSLPLAEYVVTAAKANQCVLDATAQGDPWFSSLWYFVRLMKAHPQLEGLTADEALACVTGVLNGLQVQAHAGFWTEDSDVEFLPGSSPLETAIEEARRRPVEPARCAGGRMPGYRLFVSVAVHLQAVVGDRNIMLPCAELGRRLFPDLPIGAARMQVSRMRQLAVADGYLDVVKEHRFRSKGRSAAMEFRVRRDALRLKVAVTELN